MVIKVEELYHDRDWLYDQYVRQNKKAKQIGDEVGVGEMTIWNWLSKYDLLKYKGRGRKLGARTIKRDY